MIVWLWRAGEPCRPCSPRHCMPLLRCCGAGTLDKAELRAILQAQAGGKPMSDAAFAALWPKIDTDNSGSISSEEFIAYCCRSSK